MEEGLLGMAVKAGHEPLPVKCPKTAIWSGKSSVVGGSHPIKSSVTDTNAEV